MIRIMIFNRQTLLCFAKGVHIFQQINFLDNIWRNFSHNSFFIRNKRKSFGFVSEMLMAPFTYYFANNAIININIPLSDTNDSFYDQFSNAGAQLLGPKTKYIIILEEVSIFFVFIFRLGYSKVYHRISNHIGSVRLFISWENSAVGSMPRAKTGETVWIAN